MNALWLDDFRLAIRRLRKDAGPTIAAIAALSCAIGAAAATWSLISAVLLKPLPVEAPERLYEVDTPRPPGAPARFVPGHSYPVLESFRASGVFEDIAAGGPQTMPVSEHGESLRNREVYFAAHDFFSTLGIRPARGRTFASDEDRRGAPAVAVLSDRYWRSVFNADPNVLGQTLTVSGTSATIIGILPRGFRGLRLSEAPDLYLPLQVAGDIDYPFFKAFEPLGPTALWIRIVGRLRPGQTPEVAAARLNSMDCLCGRGRTHGEVGPLTLTNVNTAAVPDRASTAQFATLFSITVGLLLLAGCLTVGVLLLVRTEDRRDELAVRLALGATRGRLASSIAVEGATLCALAALLAIPLTFWLFRGVGAFELPGAIDLGRLELTLSAGRWLAVSGAALATTAVIALLASLMGVVTAVRSPVHSRAVATPRVTRRAPRTVLVAGQVAITFVLVTGAGLFARSLVAALSLNPGIETHRVVMAGIDPGRDAFTDRAMALVEELRARLRQNRTIASASLIRYEGGMFAGTAITVDGAGREMPASLSYVAVDESYFSTVGLPIVSGRGFGPADAAGSSAVALVSESLARFIADGGSPIGRRIGPFRTGRAQAAYPEVIGVVPDLITEVSTTEPFVAYQLAAQRPAYSAATLVIRAAGDPSAAMREAMATARALDPRMTLYMATLDERILRQMNPQRFGIYVLGALGGTALLLAVLGTYVMAASMVVRRRRELGIRAALGARDAQLRRLVLRDSARLVGVGLIAGLGLAIVGTRLIRSLLYRVEPLDPLVLMSVVGGIFALALLVSLRPAVAVTRLDLTHSLREE
jgi:predicted permease